MCSIYLLESGGTLKVLPLKKLGGLISGVMILNLICLVAELFMRIKRQVFLFAASRISSSFIQKSTFKVSNSISVHPFKIESNFVACYRQIKAFFQLANFNLDM
jgi:hypothetical protein